MRTHLGYGSPNKQDTYKAHGSPLGEEEVRLTKLNLGWPTEPAFYIPRRRARILARRSSRVSRRRLRGTTSFPAMRERFQNLQRSCNKSRAAICPLAGTRAFPPFHFDGKGLSTRVASGQVMNAIASRLPSLIGESADLDPSTSQALQELGDFEGARRERHGDRPGSEDGGWSYAGRNLHFGVREHAMGAILNGLAAHGGTVPFSATFLVFSDYMRPPIRLAALMGLHVIYVFTHDSIALGEDGSTHQPVERLASLRSISWTQCHPSRGR